MTNHDPGTHHASMFGFVSDVMKGDKNRAKSSNAWVRFGRATLRIALIGLLMTSPFTLIAILLFLFG